MIGNSDLSTINVRNLNLIGFVRHIGKARPFGHTPRLG
jgi:hypothetical protein